MTSGWRKRLKYKNGLILIGGRAPYYPMQVYLNRVFYAIEIRDSSNQVVRFKERLVKAKELIDRELPFEIGLELTLRSAGIISVRKP